MKTHEIAMLIAELSRRGFGPGGEAPNGSMYVDPSFVERFSLAEFLDRMVQRREKIAREASVVGVETMRLNHADAEAVVDATKQVIDALLERAATAAGS